MSRLGRAAQGKALMQPSGTPAVDAIVAPSGRGGTSPAAVAVYPNVAVPVGLSTLGNPAGIHVYSGSRLCLGRREEVTPTVWFGRLTGTAQARGSESVPPGACWCRLLPFN
jgi:hypothetical protein